MGGWLGLIWGECDKVLVEDVHSIFIDYRYQRKIQVVFIKLYGNDDCNCCKSCNTIFKIGYEYWNVEIKVK